MEEKDALPNTPERSCSELIGACGMQVSAGLVPQTEVTVLN
jgi:hypothetical protein